MSDAGGHNEADRRGGWRPRGNKWLIAIVVTLAAFMEILDTTIVVVSLRHIAGTMSVSYDDATWSLTSYLIANGVVLTISGWLARVFGRKRYFLVCIGMFSVCSLLCGISESLTQLILARLAQGFFGGGLQPTQQSILLDTFEPSQRARAFAITAIATVVAPVLGPTLGGWITDNYSWRWVFLINVPVGALTFFAVMHLIEDPPWARAQRTSTDIVGLSFITLGLGCLQVVMDRGEDEDWFESNFIRVFAALATIGILGAIAWLLYAKKPVINIRVFKDSNFALASALMAAMAGILYTSAVIIPQLAQQSLGYDATHAGLVITPSALLVMVLIPIVSFAQRLVPVKYVIATGFLVLGLAMFYSHDRLTPDVSYGELVILRCSQAAGLAFLFAPLGTIAFANIRREDNGDATALFTMFRNVAGSIGISLSTAITFSRTQVRMAHLAPHATPLDPGFALTLQQYQETLLAQGHAAATTGSTALGLLYQGFRGQAAILAYTDIFALCGIMAFCVVPLALFLCNQKGGGAGAAG
jgi:DHA2 family multidrug resistance protein